MIVCFEGIDACGKSTQIEMLMKVADAKKIDSLHYSYPNYHTDTGKKILELLKAPERDPLVLQCLMTVNRYEQQHEIERAHISGRLVILDRYWLSGLVYGLSDELSRHWLLRIHDRLIQPHQWIVLDLPVEESFRRRPVRDDAYETSKERMEFCRQEYRDAQDMISDLVVIDATRDAEDIHARVLKILELD